MKSEENKVEKKLSTESYKGVRDFYPEDMLAQKHIFERMRVAVEKFGYVEYGASVLEPAELYRAKSGEEIINEQTYTFTDRGDREVTLRPEMTPTVARMVSGRRRELVFPLRWYSIPNLFRYEQPQRGRTREHWQLNVDLFGSDSTDADVEIISVANEVMRSFGATSKDFEIRVNSRKLWNALCDFIDLNDTQKHKVSKLLDKKSKMSTATFETEVQNVIGDKSEKLLQAIGKSDIDKLPEDLKSTEGYLELKAVLDKFAEKDFENVIYDPSIMRGFDYYTGVVFEVFDTSPENRRALFGGGRYDDLTSLFGGDKIPAVGFGAGDVTMRDFLETRGLLPVYKPSAELYIAIQDEACRESAEQLAAKLRSENVKVIIDISRKKLGDQIKTADRQKIPFVTAIGAEEAGSGAYRVKNLAESSEKILKAEEITKYLKTQILL